jgi:hypothetical protein
MESQIEFALKKMKAEKKYIALSLQPPIGHSTIESEGNRMFINEGRDGKFDGVSESFYDLMVEKYDSRSSMETLRFKAIVSGPKEYIPEGVRIIDFEITEEDPPL